MFEIIGEMGTFNTIMLIFATCLILLMFSDGIIQGLRLTLFLVCFVGLPIYFMIYLDSGIGIALGAGVGVTIMLTVETLFTVPDGLE